MATNSRHKASHHNTHAKNGLKKVSILLFSKVSHDTSDASYL